MPYTGLFQFLRAILEPDTACRLRGVNALYGPFSISTPGRRIRPFQGRVSMPYTGFFQFLLYEYRRARVSALCQCPIRAFFNFYQDVPKMRRFWRDRCQCPIRAFFNFYGYDTKIWSLCKGGVNALYGPFSISTRHWMPRQSRTECVNALDGPFSISTKVTSGGKLVRTRCQCPIRAFFNFYPVAYDEIDNLVNLCQCPIRAFFNFYVCVKIRASALTISVNALYGPFSISTAGGRLFLRLAEGVSMPYTGLFQFLPAL